MSSIYIKVGQLGIRYLIDGSQSASMGMFELTVPPASLKVPGSIFPVPMGQSKLAFLDSRRQTEREMPLTL